VKILKILVTWYSGTGNTEKIAKAINEGITGHDVDLLPVNDVDPTSLNSYDLVFLGSGLYGFNVSRKITKLVKKAPQLPSKFAYFQTHENPQPNPYPDAFSSINKIIEPANCEVLGQFDCTGENLVEKAEEQRQARWGTLAPDERKKSEESFFNLVKGHPNEKDFENAKNFATSIINKL